MATINVDVKYDEGLVKCIQELFINIIVPENFLLVIHKYDVNVLTVADIQRLRKRLDSHDSKDVNYNLLMTMKNYKGWFEVILKVCKDSDIKQGFLAEEFEKLKRQLDEKWHPSQAEQEQLISKLGELSLTSNDAIAVDGAPGTRRKSDVKNNKKCQDVAETKEYEMKDGSGHCFVCDVELTSEKFKDIHISGKAHQKKAKERLQNSSFDETHAEETVVAAPDSNNYYILNADGTGECKICEVKFTSAQNADQHLEGSKHKKKIEALETKIVVKAPPTLGPNGEIYFANEHGKGTCYVCGVSLTSKEDTQQHLAGKKHKNKCAESGLK